MSSFPPCGQIRFACPPSSKTYFDVLPKDILNLLSQYITDYSLLTTLLTIKPLIRPIKTNVRVIYTSSHTLRSKDILPFYNLHKVYPIINIHENTTMNRKLSRLTHLHTMKVQLSMSCVTTVSWDKFNSFYTYIIKFLQSINMDDRDITFTLIQPLGSPTGGSGDFYAHHRIHIVTKPQEATIFMSTLRHEWIKPILNVLNRPVRLITEHMASHSFLARYNIVSLGYIITNNNIDHSEVFRFITVIQGTYNIDRVYIMPSRDIYNTKELISLLFGIQDIISTYIGIIGTGHTKVFGIPLELDCINNIVKSLPRVYLFHTIYDPERYTIEYLNNTSKILREHDKRLVIHKTEEDHLDDLWDNISVENLYSRWDMER